MARIITYQRTSYVKKDGKCPVYLQVHVDKRKVVLPGRIEIEPEYWDEKKCTVKSSCSKSKEYNMILQQSIGIANDILIKYFLMQQPLTPEILKKEYNNPSKSIDFYEWWEREIQNRKGVITESTIKMHNHILRKMKGFRADLKFCEITHDLVAEFDKYLKVRLNNSLNTRHKVLKTLKAYANIAFKRGLLKESPFKEFKIKQSDGTFTYLSEHELRKLIALYKEKSFPENILRVLRYFLFACFAAGPRISDIKTLTVENIIGDMLVFSPKKTKNVTSKVVQIPLNNTALQLINDAMQHSDSEKIFQTISDQKTNKVLKLIASAAGIEKKLSFKVARHTFATLYLEKHPGDIATLQKLLGHSKINTTMIYAHVQEKTKRERISVFDSFFQDEISSDIINSPLTTV